MDDLASDILEQLIEQPNFRYSKMVSNIEQTRHLDSDKQMKHMHACTL
jgi:hypothetical protein